MDFTIIFDWSFDILLNTSADNNLGYDYTMRFIGCESVQTCSFVPERFPISYNREFKRIGPDKSHRLKPALLRPAFLSWQKHSQTIFTVEILIRTLAARTRMIDFFCKSMASSNFCYDWNSALTEWSILKWLCKPINCCIDTMKRRV